MMKMHREKRKKEDQENNKEKKTLKAFWIGLRFRPSQGKKNAFSLKFYL